MHFQKEFLKSKTRKKRSSSLYGNEKKSHSLVGWTQIEYPHVSKNSVKSIHTSFPTVICDGRTVSTLWSFLSISISQFYVHHAIIKSIYIICNCRSGETEVSKCIIVEGHYICWAHSFSNNPSFKGWTKYGRLLWEHTIDPISTAIL